MNLARATKQNLTDFFRFLERSPAARYWEEDGLARWSTPLRHPWFNGALLRRPPRPGDEQVLAHLIAPLSQAQDVPFTLWIEWDVPRLAWQPTLSALGFVHDNGAPGMVYDLDKLPRLLAKPPNFEIRHIVDDAGLRTWTETFIRGYELPEDWTAGLYDLLLSLGLDYPMSNFLGYLDNQPVATSSIFYSAGVAGVQFVATLPHARRRGLGGVMTLHPLYEARGRGVVAAVLQSSEMGYSVYKDLGFEHVTNVDNEYRPSSHPV